MAVSRREVLVSAPLLAVAGGGGVVRFAAPGDDDRWNACIAWAGERMLMRHCLRVRHVRDVADGADLVSLPAGRVPRGTRVAGAWRLRGLVAVFDPGRERRRMAGATTLAEARATFVRGDADWYLAGNPGEATCGIARGVLPAGTRAVPLAPPRPDMLALVSPSPAATLLARFLRSAEAQAHFAEPQHCAAPPLA